MDCKVDQHTTHLNHRPGRLDVAKTLRMMHQVVAHPLLLTLTLQVMVATIIAYDYCVVVGDSLSHS